MIFFLWNIFLKCYKQWENYSWIKGKDSYEEFKTAKSWALTPLMAEFYRQQYDQVVASLRNHYSVYYQNSTQGYVFDIVLISIQNSSEIRIT